MISQKLSAEILSEIENAKVDWTLLLQCEEAVVQETDAMLGAAGDVAGTLRSILAALGARMEQIFLEASGKVQGKYRLEQLLLAERQRGGTLENTLHERREVVEIVMEESEELAAQVQDHLVNRAVLKMQVNEVLCWCNI
jgi:hypothetical protein